MQTIYLVHNYIAHQTLSLNSEKHSTPTFNWFDTTGSVGKLIVMSLYFLSSRGSRLYEHACKGNWKEVRYMLNRGANVNYRDFHSGRTALNAASYIGSRRVVRLLLDQEGVDVNSQDGWGDTALIEASLRGKVEVVRDLLNHEGVNVNIRSNSGSTALIDACEKGNLEVVLALLDHERVNVNIRDNHGDTALILASKNGHAEVVRALLNHEGMDVNAMNNLGSTALDVARRGQKHAVVLLLEQHLERRENLLEE